MSKAAARRGALALAVVGCVGLLVPLVAYASLGQFSRYAADDYCTAGQLAAKGLFGMQAELYQAWSGRFSFTFMVGLVELFGPGVVPILPGVALTAWLVALAWSITRAPGVVGGWPPPLVGLLLASTLIFATLSSVPDLGQSLLWQTGLLTYLAPLVLWTLLAGLVLQRLRLGTAPSTSLLGCALLSLTAAGTSETSALVGTLGLGMVVCCAVASPVRVRWVLVRLLAAALAGSVLALLIVALAPGNAVRAAAGGHIPDLAFALGAARGDLQQFLHDWWRFTPGSLVVALLVPAGIALLDPAPCWDARRALPWLGIGVVLGLALMLAALALSFYALGAPLPGRARIIPQFVLVVLTAGIGYAAAASLRAVLPLAARPLLLPLSGLGLLGTLVLGPLPATRTALALVPAGNAYALRWDLIDAQLRSARANGIMDPRVPPMEVEGIVRGMDFLSRDTNDWLNVCAARYYGLRSIRAE